MAYTNISLPSMPNEILHNIINFLREDLESTSYLAFTSKEFYSLVFNINVSFRLLRSYFYLRNKKWSVIKHKEEISYIFYEERKFVLSRYTNRLLAVDEMGRRYEQAQCTFLNPITNCYYHNSHTFDIFNPTSSSDKSSQEVDAAWIVLNDKKIQKDKVNHCHLLEEGKGFILIRPSGYVLCEWINQQIKCRANRMINPLTSQISKSIIEDSAYFNQTLFLKVKRKKSSEYYKIKPLLRDVKLQRLTLTKNLFLQIEQLVEHTIQQWKLTVLSNQLYVSCFDGSHRYLISVEENQKGEIALTKDQSNSCSIGQIKAEPIAFGKWTIYLENQSLCVFNAKSIWIPPTKEYTPVPRGEFAISQVNFFVHKDCLFLVYQHNFRVIYLPTKKEITDSFSELKKYVSKQSTLYSLSLDIDHTNNMYISAVVRNETKLTGSGFYSYKFNINLEDLEKFRPS